MTRRTGTAPRTRPERATLPFPIVVTDPRPPRAAPPGWLGRRAAPWVHDPRDVVFVALVLTATIAILPFAVLLWSLPGWAVFALAPLYLALLYAVLGGPVMLMVHAVSHRPTFRGPGAWLERYVRHVLPLAWGISPHAYTAHHVLMHHREENAEADVSSTLGHVRDSKAGFARYYLRFLLCGHLHMTHYLVSRGHRALAARMWAGELGFLACFSAALTSSPAAAIVTLGLPYVLTRFFLMAGNWAQHAFVDPAAPTDGVRNATILVNSPQNRRCFNDGYHAVHHRYPGMHWTDMATHFAGHWQDYAKRGVIVFVGAASQQAIWWRLMRGDYGWLADRIAPLDAYPATRAERIEWLRQRVRHVPIAPKGMIEPRERAAASPGVALRPGG